MILRGRIVALATPSTGIYIHHTYNHITLLSTSHCYRHSAERAPHRIDDGHGLLL